MTPEIWLMVGMGLGLGFGVVVALEYRARWLLADRSKQDYRAKWLQAIGANENADRAG